MTEMMPRVDDTADAISAAPTVMGLDYAYPIDAIVRDNRRIFAAIDSRDGEAAVALWRRKMDDAREYMLPQLSVTKPRPTGTV